MTKAVPGRLLRSIAWLLTPLVVWAASFLGGWLGALTARLTASPQWSAGLLVLGAGVFGAAALAGWVRLLRRRWDGVGKQPLEKP